MKTTKFIANALLLGVVTILLSTASPAFVTSAQQVVPPAPVLTDAEKQMVDTFNRHVKDYLKQREKAAAKLPKLSKEAKPEEIEAYQKSFVAALRAMRAGTQRGYIFKQDFTQYVRTIIQTEFPTRDKVEIKQTILEAENKGVPLKINHPYPESKELTQIPPTLLLKLPTLPKQVKFRFVNRHLLLVDTDNGLIVDYTLNALP